MAFVWLLKRFMDGLVFDTTRTINLFWLTTTCVLLGSLFYVYLAWIFIPSELYEVLNLFSRIDVIKKTVSKYKKIVYPNSSGYPYDDRVDEQIWM